MASNNRNGHDAKTMARAELVAEAIRISILEGATKHQDKLDGRIIADRYTVNIAVAEAAVKKLTMEGFARKFGSHVGAVSMSPDEVLKLANERSFFEGAVFLENMPKKSQRDFDEITNIIRNGLSSTTRREFITADISIFRLMYKEPYHSFRMIALKTKGLYRKYDYYSWINHDVARENLLHYRKVIELCRSGDYTEAQNFHLNYLCESSIVIYRDFWKKLIVRFSNE